MLPKTVIEMLGKCRLDLSLTKVIRRENPTAVVDLSRRRNDAELLIVTKLLYSLWGILGLMPMKNKALKLFSILWFLIPVIFLLCCMYIASIQIQTLPCIMVVTTVSVRVIQWSEYIALFGRSAFGELGHLRIFLHGLKYVDQHLHLENTGSGKTASTILFTSMMSALVILSVQVTKVHGGTLEQYRLLCYVSYVTYSVIWAFVTPHFTLLVTELKLRYKALNRQLILAILADSETAGCANECLTEILIGDGRMSREEKKASFKDLRAAYAVLHRAAEALQQQYGPAVALMVASAFFGVVCSSYEIIVSVMEDFERQAGTLSRSLFVSSLWLTAHGVKLVAVSMSCAAACDEERRTTVLLHRAVTASALCGCPLPEAEAFLREVRAGPPLNFTAGGFFDIRRSLIISTFATVVTHIVILTQFGVEPQSGSLEHN